VAQLGNTVFRGIAGNFAALTVLVSRVSALAAVGQLVLK
jgi:hypothetical protein